VEFPLQFVANHASACISCDEDVEDDDCAEQVDHEPACLVAGLIVTLVVGDAEADQAKHPLRELVKDFSKVERKIVERL